MVLKTILNPGEEVIVLAPYFAEYLFYIDNHGGVGHRGYGPGNLQPDARKIYDAITPRTKAIIINSPTTPPVSYTVGAHLKNFGGHRKRQDEFGTAYASYPTSLMTK